MNERNNPDNPTDGTSRPAMDQAIAIIASANGSEIALAELAEKARGYVASAKAPETIRGYRVDWRDFEDWCARHRCLTVGHRRKKYKRN